MIGEAIQEDLLRSDTNKALGTYGSDGINVVPVSTIKIVEGNIWLFDYFFDKTKNNVLENQDVSLTYWIGLCGHQIKARGTYLDSGDDFNAAVSFVKKLHPTRVLKGLLILKPNNIFGISIDTKV